MVIMAFVCLGFLLGNLIGLSAESTLGVVIPILFTFGGSSAVAFLHKLEQAERRLTSAAVVSLCLSCFAGVYLGILVSEHQWLTPKEVRQARITQSVAESKYLRAYYTSESAQIDQLYRAQQISAQQAYEQLYQLLSSREGKE